MKMCSEACCIDSRRRIFLGTWAQFSSIVASLLIGSLVSGCAALSNPVANGIPARRLPPELLGESKADQEAIPLALLRRKPADDYLVGPGDVLGIWIEGVLGEKGQSPPIHSREPGASHSSLGYPIPVRKDGTISLPLIRPLKVQGLTLEQAEDTIRRAYTVDKQIIKAGQERIIVTLQERRKYHVLVIRQDSAEMDPGGPPSFGGRSVGFAVGFGTGINGTRRGQGFALDLPAYENDVLNALARTGGFPGTDAQNEIIIERGAFAHIEEREKLLKGVGQDPTVRPTGRRTIRIPLRGKPEHIPPLRQEDIILEDGDIVFIEARETDVYYTAGILPSGKWPLPRDQDLDVLEAIAQIGGPINSGGINGLNVGGIFLTPGLGFPSPSLVTIIRQAPGGTQLAIQVDLNRALRNREERILIQPRDLIILQERPADAIARYITSRFNFGFVWQAIASPKFQGNATGIVP